MTRSNRWLWTLFQFILRMSCVLVFRFRAFGASRIPSHGGVLLVSNHQSYLDPVILSLAPGRMMSYMARRSLFRNPVFGGFLRAVNAFPVTRSGRDIGALREGIQRLQFGACLIVFPEGTRTSDGEIASLRSGALMMAARAGVPVVPAVVEGAFQAWPKGRLPKRHSIWVGYGDPIDPRDVRQMKRDALMARIHAEMIRLQTDLRQRMVRALT